MHIESRHRMAPKWVPVTAGLWGLRCVLSLSAVVPGCHHCPLGVLMERDTSSVWGHRHLFVGLTSPWANLSLILASILSSQCFFSPFPFSKYNICVFFFVKIHFWEDEKTDEKVTLVFSQERHCLAFVQRHICSPFFESRVPAVVGLGRVGKVTVLCCADCTLTGHPL